MVGNVKGDRVRREDRRALRSIVTDHGVCAATGEWLRPDDAVAMTVEVSPGVRRLAVVSGNRWDGGKGEFSAADPRVDADVLDGRKLFPPARGGAVAARRERKVRRAGRRSREAGPGAALRPQAAAGAERMPRPS